MEFAAIELQDMRLGPGSLSEGVLFTRPLSPDHAVTVTLRPVLTGQALTFTLPIPPPPVDAQLHQYSQPYPFIWEAAVKAASQVPSWMVLATDEAHGTVTVARRRLLRFGPRVTMRISVQRLDAGRTQVSLVRLLPPADTAASAGAQFGIAKFFRRMEEQLPQPPPEAAPATVSGTQTLPSAVRISGQLPYR